MAEIIGVRFKPGGKLYYFQPNDEYLFQGSYVIVETSRGVECGEVAMERRTIPDEQITHELKKVIRAATPEDLKRVEDNHEKEKSAFTICEQKIARRGLDMKLVNVEYAFDGSKILFNFTADDRVDFRELVKDLVSVFHTRIELRQIGVRDVAKMCGGLGVCGRPFCCSTFLGDFVSVSIKMAKEQGLSLNPVKISGTCGRLMCCLKYEEDVYKDLIRHTPKVGMHVSTPDGKGTVVEVNMISGNLRILLDDAPDAGPKTYHKKLVAPAGDPSAMSEAEAAHFSAYEEPGESRDEERRRPSSMSDDRDDSYGLSAQAPERPRNDSRRPGRQGGQGGQGGQRPGRGNRSEQDGRNGQQPRQNGGQGGQRPGRVNRSEQDGRNGQQPRQNGGQGKGGQNNQNRQNGQNRQNQPHQGGQNKGGQGKGGQNGQNNQNRQNQPRQGGGQNRQNQPRQNKPQGQNQPKQGGQNKGGVNGQNNQPRQNQSRPHGGQNKPQGQNQPKQGGDAPAKKED